MDVERVLAEALRCRHSQLSFGQQPSVLPFGWIRAWLLKFDQMSLSSHSESSGWPGPAQLAASFPSQWDGSGSGSPITLGEIASRKTDTSYF